MYVSLYSLVPWWGFCDRTLEISLHDQNPVFGDRTWSEGGGASSVPERFDDPRLPHLTTSKGCFPILRFGGRPALPTPLVRSNRNGTDGGRTEPSGFEIPLSKDLPHSLRRGKWSSSLVHAIRFHVDVGLFRGIPCKKSRANDSWAPPTYRIGHSWTF